MGLKKLENKYTSIDVGSDLTLEQYSKIIHKEKDGYITVATKSIAGDWKEKSHPVGDWFNHVIINENLNCYQSMNSFFIPKRNEKNVRHIENFYCDVDFYNNGLSLEKALEMIDFLINTDRILTPTLTLYSGKGISLIWGIESVPGSFLKVKRLYSLIQKFLIKELESVGSDPAACDISRVLKIPSTFNNKTGEKVKVLRYTEKFYTMRFLQEFMNDMNDYEPKVFTKSKKSKKTKILNLYNFYSLAVSRAKDLEKLCELRAYDISGIRNTLMHIYSYQQMLIHKDFHIVRSKVVKLNDKLVEPLTDKNIESICRDSARAFRDKQKDDKAGYNYKNLTIIEKLEIKQSEQRELSSLIDKTIKQERNTESKRIKRRNSDGLTVREEKKQQLIEQVKDLHSKGFKQRDIAIELGIHKSNVSRYLKK
jgi:hypothetical protein